ncbi:ATP-binding protein [Rhodococcus sp. PvR099]|uniref:ATP-binding protein n=1 Tax=Rhodococcus sp. PvR099 TaxID=2806602 RepID=UPI0027DB1026|nr:ATP-binding protein [Rhodococcus sp. PvR099]
MPRLTPRKANRAPHTLFTDPRLCAAIIDRFTHRNTIIETGTHAYRLTHAEAATTG